MNQINGKIALVTGASQGVGASIAESLIRAGATVIGIASRQERLTRFSESLKDKQSQFHPIVCDLSQVEQVVSAFEKIKSEFGTIHILVNNAAVLFNDFIIGNYNNFSIANPKYKLGVTLHQCIPDSDVEKFQTILNVNVLAYAVCINKTIKIMRDTNVNGHIINVNR